MYLDVILRCWSTDYCITDSQPSYDFFESSCVDYAVLRAKHNIDHIDNQIFDKICESRMPAVLKCEE